MPKTISVFYSFPRSGGTLLNQCLLCAKSTVVLSEVNPASSYLAPERQAHEWFGLLHAHEAAALSTKTYLEKVSAVALQCSRRQLQLCVRDWVAVNFIPKLTPFVPVASGVLEQRLFLQLAGYELREIVLLRRSRDIFDSLRRHMPGFEHYSPASFARHYGAYLKAVAGISKFYLEDFTRDPDTTLRDICRALGLEFPPKFKDEFHRKESVTGNNTLQSKPPSASATRIEAGRPSARLARHESGRERAIFARLDALAGYEAEEAS